MSPATARIHRRNINNPSQAATAGGADSGRATLRQPVAITIPSFSALPLFLPLTEEQRASHAPSSSSTSKRRRGQAVTSSASRSSSPPSPPPSPPSALVSSRGRHIKLREGSIHLQRREHSAASASSASLSPASALSPSPPTVASFASAAAAAQPSSSSSHTQSPHTVADGEQSTATLSAADSATLVIFSSPLYRSWVHSWCLWQMRCDYLLGEVRRRLSKREAGRARQSPHGNRRKGQATQTEHRTTDTGKEEAERKERQESSEEERKETAADAPSVASPDYLASLIGRIPPLHTQLTLPLLDSLPCLSSIAVPPSALHLPLLSTLAACLMLPLPPQLSAVPSSAHQRPFCVNYPLEQGQVWTLPEQRIAVQWTDAPKHAEEEEARTGRRSVGPASRSSNGRQANHRAQPSNKRAVERKQHSNTTRTQQKKDSMHTDSGSSSGSGSGSGSSSGSVSRGGSGSSSGRVNGERTSQERDVSGPRLIQTVKQQLRMRAAVRRESRWQDEPSVTDLREANRLSRQRRMAEREQREKVREARQLTLPQSKRRRMESIVTSNPNDIAAQAANDLLAAITETPM